MQSIVSLRPGAAPSVSTRPYNILYYTIEFLQKRQRQDAAYSKAVRARRCAPVLPDGHIFVLCDRDHNVISEALASYNRVGDRGQMEEPKYTDINEAELRDIEAELGHPVTRELAQWFIRNRTNREAVERMLGAVNTTRVEPDSNLRNVHNIKTGYNRKTVSVMKKRTKKCA